MEMNIILIQYLLARIYFTDFIKSLFCSIFKFITLLQQLLNQVYTYDSKINNKLKKTINNQIYKYQ